MTFWRFINILVTLVRPCTPAYNGSNWCYYLTDTNVSWADGRDTCRQEGGSLAEVHDLQTHNYLTQYITDRNVNEAWIGARKEDTGWQWIDDTSAGSY